MSTYRIAALLVILAVASLFVGGVNGQTPDSTAVKELMALDQAWIDAEVGRDQAALENILHEDFLATLPSGRTIDREAFIAMILKSNLEPFEVIHETVKVHDETAVVIDTSTDGDMKYTWIAIRQEGRWRVISETFSKVQTAQQ